MTIAHPRRGFTLLEMVVVLAILTVVATLAVRSVDGRIDQSRYEATQTQLQAVNDAVLGVSGARQSDGSLSASGFVSDIGRLPYAIDEDSDSTTIRQPQELWIKPSTIVKFDFYIASQTQITSVLGVASTSISAYPAPAYDASDVEDLNIRVACGWRGPYLRLSAGQTKLNDGWGHPFNVLQTDGTTDVSADTQEIGQFKSFGADGAASGTGYDLDVAAIFLSVSAGLDPAHGVLTGNFDFVSIPVPGTAVDVRVFLYAPDPAANGKIKVYTQKIKSDETFTFPPVNVTTGARVLRARYDDLSRVSRILNVVIPPGGTSVSLKF